MRIRHRFPAIPERTGAGPGPSVVNVFPGEGNRQQSTGTCPQAACCFGIAFALLCGNVHEPGVRTRTMKIADMRAPRLRAPRGARRGRLPDSFMSTEIKAAAGRPSGRRRSSQIIERVKNPKITLVQGNLL